MRVNTRTLGLAVALFAAGVAGGWLLQQSGFGAGAPVEAPPLPAPPTPEGQNGLSTSERAEFYHLSEGGELYPVTWFLALEMERTAADGTRQVRPFLENIERYGLLSDPKSAGNPDGLPVGISLGRSKAEGIDMIGLNCTACHVGQVQYQGHAVRVDGLGNMALINAFLADMGTETQRTLESPSRLVRFWKRVRAIREERRARGREVGLVHDDERALRRVLGTVTHNRDLVEARLRGLKSVASLQHSLRISTQEGYGRLDAFGIGRDELFGSVPGNASPADAPVSLPHIWGMEYTGWLQWGANTDSVMERNIGQALGVGALLDPATYDSSVNIPNLHRLEQYAYKLTPPTWPATFPAVDPVRVEKGKALFVSHCVECHETYTTDGVMRTYQLFAFAQTGTDPLTAINYELPVAQADGTVLPFPYAAGDLISKIKWKAYRDAGYDAATIDRLEHRQVRRGPQWDPVFRAPMLDGAKYSDTIGRRVYRAKSLVGIWATAPFLHNGSVPTIFDLLHPATMRPASFPLGTREYDPIKLGVQTDPSKYALVANQTPFTFDTRLPGNWNTGHEWGFYPSLDDDARYAIIEFLKTFTSESVLGLSAPPTRAAVSIGNDIPPSEPPLPRRTPLSARALAAIAVAIALAGIATFYIVSGVMPHGEAARATEAEDTVTLTRGILAIQQKFATGQNRPLARGTHAKGMCVRGVFEVFDVYEQVPDRLLAARLAQGVFVKPGAYPAIVRFANGDSHIYPDRKKDVRACSFSIDVPPGVVGSFAQRLDFSMNDAPTFPINDPHAFAVTTNVVAAPTMWKGFRALSLKDKLSFVRTATLGAFQERPGTAAFQLLTYWSTVPFHHGPADVVKYAAMPCPGNYAEPIGTGPDCLQDELARHLTHDAQMSCFDIALQVLDVEKMKYWGRRRSATFWIENASVKWKESQAPFHTVGRLTLVRNSVLPAEVCAAMWIDVTTNSAPDCKPLGGINRARPIAEAASRNARLGLATTSVASNVS